MAKYLFIDGRYLDLTYNDLIKDFCGVDGELDIATVIAHFSPQRTYYYNAVDDEQGKDETLDAFKARVETAVARFEAINALPGCHVRYGSITGRAHKKPRRQKEVDVQLAVDALLHTFNHNVGVVMLLAGDLDFKPLIDALVSLGVDTRIWYEKRSAQPPLYRAADHATEIDLRMAWEWSSAEFRAAHPIPSVARNSTPDLHGVHERIGSWKGRETRLIKQTDNKGKVSYYIYAKPLGREQSLQVMSDDIALLDKFFTFVYGPPEWTDYANN